MRGLSREENMRRFADTHLAQLPWLIEECEAQERELEQKLAEVRAELACYRERAAQERNR